LGTISGINNSVLIWCSHEKARRGPATQYLTSKTSTSQVRNRCSDRAQRWSREQPGRIRASGQRSSPPSDADNKLCYSRAPGVDANQRFCLRGPASCETLKRASPRIGRAPSRKPKMTRAVRKKKSFNCRLEGDIEPLLMSTV